tara:strand:- start:1307 stop:1537 length:231 start_codon:yes stop_codon:yes gene_type:complete
VNLASILLAMLSHDLRTGTKDADDINAIADWLDERGESEEAHVVRCALIYANVPSQSDWEAQKRRERFEIVPDGGN